MNGAEALIDSIDRAGLRLTTPRRLVAELVAARDGHFTALDLVVDARRERRPIGRATVFRALELFTELGLVERVDLPSGEHAYVACQAVHHHHAICTACGRSLDVNEAGLGPVLDDIARRLDFRVTSHRVELFGICAACRGSTTH
jgi:Fur family transcriptional regulator, ferric uptake regulator